LAVQSDAFKDLGNKAFAAKEYDKAIDLFSRGIELDPQNHVLYSNRSAAYGGKKDWTAALEDAEQVSIASIFCTKAYHAHVCDQSSSASR
jgi:stress-induced-phosphoprotein 1